MDAGRDSVAIMIDSIFGKDVRLDLFGGSRLTWGFVLLPWIGRDFVVRSFAIATEEIH